MTVTDVLAAVFHSAMAVKRRGTRFEAVPLRLSRRNQERAREAYTGKDERTTRNEHEVGGKREWVSDEREREREKERRDVAKPVFERSGESGGYTFTDLHYPGFAPTPSDTHPWACSQRTNCPVTHRPHVHVIGVTHKMTPRHTSPTTSPRTHTPRPSTVFYSEIMSRDRAETEADLAPSAPTGSRFRIGDDECLIVCKNGEAEMGE